MSYPTYFISSSVVNVDTTTTSKILMLPTASTIQGIPLTIVDTKGMAATNPIYVSTQRFDLMDNYASTIQLNTNYQSFRIVPYSTTRYAISLNYTGGLSPFLFALYLYYYLTTSESVRSWKVFAISATGSILLAAESLGSLYLSTDAGASWASIPGFTSYQWSGVCMSANGAIMLGSISGNTLVVSKDGGSTWTKPTGIFNWGPVGCSSNGVRMVSVDATTLYPGDIYLSANSGDTFTNAGQSNANHTGCCMSGDGNVVYASTYNNQIHVSTNIFDYYSWTFVGPSKIWLGVYCNSNGAIAYAAADTGELYKTTDYGSNWSMISAIYGYRSPVCDSTGDVVIAGDSTGSNLYISRDGGVTFVQYNSDSNVWSSGAALNGAGTQFITGRSPGLITLGSLVLS